MHSRCIGNDGKPVFASIMCRGRQKLYSEINDHPFAVAVQWHPEMMYDSSEQLKLLRAFVEAAGKETEARIFVSMERPAQS